MSKSLHETQRLSFDGAVDADGHILEPPDVWETYLEPKYRDRALRIVRDDDGLEELEIGGERSRMSRKGFPSTLGAMGDPQCRGAGSRATARPRARPSREGRTHQSSAGRPCARRSSACGRPAGPAWRRCRVP